MSEGFVPPAWLRVTEEDLLREEAAWEAARNERLVRILEGISRLPVNADGTVSIPIVREAE